MTETLVLYNKSRAVLAVFVPVAVVIFCFFPALIGWMKVETQRQEIGMIAISIGVLWWGYALLADAIEMLKQPFGDLSLDNDTLRLPDGMFVKLADIDRVYSEDRFLKSPTVTIVTASREFSVLTGFQAFSSQKTAEQITERLLDLRAAAHRVGYGS